MLKDTKVDIARLQRDIKLLKATISAQDEWAATLRSVVPVEYLDKAMAVHSESRSQSNEFQRFEGVEPDDLKLWIRVARRLALMLGDGTERQAGLILDETKEQVRLAL